MPNDLEKNIADLIETVAYIKDNMATKDDLKNLVTKDDWEQFKAETTGEFRMIRAELAEIKADLKKLEKRTREDADAAATEVLALRRRVEALEQQVRVLQAA